MTLDAIGKMKTKIFADGADKEAILALYKKPYIMGFTTNPTLMRKAGISNYKEFAPRHPEGGSAPSIPGRTWQNTIATHNVLSCMKEAGVRRIAFSSTGSVYGEATVIPTPEDAPFPVQTSLYGASKLACEGLIAAFCEAYGFQAWIFRFVSILGERYTHGHVFDFYRQLSVGTGKLDVLGDGTQKKSYLYIQDCIDAIMIAVEKAKEKVNIFNLGTDEYIEVRDSIRFITEELAVKPKLLFAGGSRGWIGDNPFILLSCTRIRALGWAPKVTIREGIVRRVRFLRSNDWVFAARETPAWL